MEKRPKTKQPLPELTYNLRKSSNLLLQNPTNINKYILRNSKPYTNNIITTIASDACSASNCRPSESDFSIGSPNYNPRAQFAAEKPSRNSVGNAIALPYSSSILMKSAKEKTMEIVVAAADVPAETMSNKALLTPLGKNKSKGKTVALLSDHPTVMKYTKERAKASVVPSDDLPSQKRNNGKENMKKELAIFSCPNLLGTKTTRKRGNEINNTEPMKSWINPRLKKIKKRSKMQEIDTEYCLPRDYCDEQRAYYKEIDDFELLEEEISY